MLGVWANYNLSHDEPKRREILKIRHFTHLHFSACKNYSQHNTCPVHSRCSFFHVTPGHCEINFRDLQSPHAHSHDFAFAVV